MVLPQLYSAYVRTVNSHSVPFLTDSAEHLGGSDAPRAVAGDAPAALSRYVARDGRDPVPAGTVPVTVAAGEQPVERQARQSGKRRAPTRLRAVSCSRDL